VSSDTNLNNTKKVEDIQLTKTTCKHFYISKDMTGEYDSPYVDIIGIKYECKYCKDFYIEKYRMMHM
jgi:hypothetical protein